MTCHSYTCHNDNDLDSDINSDNEINLRVTLKVAVTVTLKEIGTVIVTVTVW